MDFVQKIIVYGFLIAFIGFIVFGVYITGILRKKIVPFSLDDKKQIILIRDYLRNLGISSSFENSRNSVLTLSEGKSLYIERKRGLPWIVFDNKPGVSGSGRAGVEVPYTVIEFPNHHNIEGFVGNKRFMLSQQYHKYFSENYNWDDLREITFDSMWDTAISISTKNFSSNTDFSHFAHKAASYVKKCPAANPLLVIAHKDKIMCYFPGRLASKENLEYVADLIRNFKL